MKLLLVQLHSMILIIIKRFEYRMKMNSSKNRWPFQMQRRQFPVVVSLAMSINKSEGQSLKQVDFYLPKPIFSHRQFYVVLSWVKSAHGLIWKFSSPMKITSNPLRPWILSTRRFSGTLALDLKVYNDFVCLAKLLCVPNPTLN